MLHEISFWQNPRVLGENDNVIIRMKDAHKYMLVVNSYVPLYTLVSCSNKLLHSATLTLSQSYQLLH